MNPTDELAIRILVFLAMATVGIASGHRDFQRARHDPRVVPRVVIGYWVALIAGGLIPRRWWRW